MPTEQETDAVSRGQPVDPYVCPRGHHSITIHARRFSCETCRNQGRATTVWDKADLVDLREDPHPRAGGDSE